MIVMLSNIKIYQILSIIFALNRYSTFYLKAQLFHSELINKESESLNDLKIKNQMIQYTYIMLDIM